MQKKSVTIISIIALVLMILYIISNVIYIFNNIQRDQVSLYIVAGALIGALALIIIVEKKKRRNKK